MYYKDYLKICEEEGYKEDNLLALLEIEQAYELAKSMHRANLLTNNMRDKHPEVASKMDNWIRGKNEKRLTHMFNAIDFAEISTNLGNPFEEYIKETWKDWGMKIPKI